LDAPGNFLPHAQTISLYTIASGKVSVSLFTLSASNTYRKAEMGTRHEDGESFAVTRMRQLDEVTKFVASIATD
jgi:hypothetical protein